MDRVAKISFKAVCSWKPEKESKLLYLPSGFTIKCNNPKIETGRYYEWEQAYEEFTAWVSSFVKTLIPTGSQSLFIEGSIFGCKTSNCKPYGGGFSLECDKEDLKISWDVFISHHNNRTLDEFEPVVETLGNTIQDLKDDGVTITITPAGETA